MKLYITPRKLHVWLYCLNVYTNLLYLLYMFLNGNPLQWVDEHKYLEICITKDFKDNRDAKRQMTARGNVLIGKFRHCTDNIKIQLFKSFCSDMYCSHLWSNYSDTVYNKLKVAYTNTFRSMVFIALVFM